jgi:hypothetical protein
MVGFPYRFRSSTLLPRSEPLHPVNVVSATAAGTIVRWLFDTDIISLSGALAALECVSDATDPEFDVPVSYEQEGARTVKAEYSDNVSFGAAYRILSQPATIEWDQPSYVVIPQAGTCV